MNRTTVRISHGQISYIESGHGDPLILLHAVNLAASTWSQMIPILEDDFAVYAPDMIGAGESEKPPLDSYSIENHAHDLIEFMDAVHITAPAMIVGNSMGGLIAIAVAAAEPQRVSRLAVVGCPATPVGEGIERLQETRQRWFDSTGAAIPREMEEQRSTWPSVTRAQLAELNELRAAAGPWALRNHEAIATYDVFASLNSVRCPVLVLSGELDPVASHAPRLVAGLKNTTSVTIPGTGHYPQIERPREIADGIRAFMSQSSVGPLT